MALSNGVEMGCIGRSGSMTNRRGNGKCQKPEIRISKSETNSTDEIGRIASTLWLFVVYECAFRICFGFRDSNFGFVLGCPRRHAELAGFVHRLADAREWLREIERVQLRDSLTQDGRVIRELRM